MTARHISIQLSAQEKLITMSQINFFLNFETLILEQCGVVSDGKLADDIETIFHFFLSV